MLVLRLQGRAPSPPLETMQTPRESLFEISAWAQEQTEEAARKGCELVRCYASPAPDRGSLDTDGEEKKSGILFQVELTTAGAEAAGTEAARQAETVLDLARWTEAATDTVAVRLYGYIGRKSTFSRSMKIRLQLEDFELQDEEIPPMAQHPADPGELLPPPGQGGLDVRIIHELVAGLVGSSRENTRAMAAIASANVSLTRQIEASAQHQASHNKELTLQVIELVSAVSETIGHERGILEAAELSSDGGNSLAQITEVLKEVNKGFQSAVVTGLVRGPKGKGKGKVEAEAEPEKESPLVISLRAVQAGNLDPHVAALGLTQAIPGELVPSLYRVAQALVELGAQAEGAR